MNRSDSIIKASKEPTSGHQLSAALNNKTKVILYNDLKNYNNIFTACYPYNNFISLYETAPKTGHWVCVLLHPERRVIEFFDSYGFRPDDESKFIPDSMWVLNYLSRMLYSAAKLGYKVEYNEMPLQDFSDKSIATCGRWVVYRIRNGNMSLTDFQRRFMAYDPKERDYVVTLATYNIL